MSAHRIAYSKSGVAPGVLASSSRLFVLLLGYSYLQCSRLYLCTLSRRRVRLIGPDMYAGYPAYHSGAPSDIWQSSEITEHSLKAVIGGEWVTYFRVS
jgi:hypothetical protein